MKYYIFGKLTKFVCDDGRTLAKIKIGKNMHK